MTITETRLATLFAQTKELPPEPLPEQDSRVGEAMAATADTRARKLWEERVSLATSELLSAVPELIEENARLRKALPLIEAIAEWERENGTLAGITSVEYADFCRRISQAAIHGSARAAIPAEAPTPKKIIFIRVVKLYETCQRTTFYVELATDEGLTIVPVSHRTGSVYTNFEGLTIDEARDRALMDAATWGDLLNIAVDPYIEDGVEFKPSFAFETYTTRRILAERRTGKNTNAD